MGTFILKRKVFGAVEGGLKNMSEWLRDIKKIKPGKEGIYDSAIIKKFQKKYDKYVKKVSKQNHTTSSSNPTNTTNSAKETVNGNTPTGQSPAPAPKDAEQSFLEDFKKKHPVAFDRLKSGSKITLGTGIGVGSIYAGKKYLDHSNYVDDRDAKTKELRDKIVFGK